MADSVRTVRHQRMLALFDQSEGRGLEIGPLYDPLVRRSDADVCYIDVRSGPDLREYYSAHPGVPVDDIVDPDFVLIGPDGTRTMVDAVAGAQPFDWVVASHVIEHVPDLIGWLVDVSEVLADGGKLILAVPDRRFSFDAQRPPTTVGQILLASHHKDTIPSVRAVYDHFSKVVSVEAADAWRNHLPGNEARIHPLEYVVEQLRISTEEGQYVDCHVWLFTPGSFVEQLAELARLDVIPFAVEAVIPTAPGELEFYAVLRRISRGLNLADRTAEWTSGVTALQDADVVVEPADGSSQQESTPSVPDPAMGPLSLREQKLVQAKRALMAKIRRAHAIIKRRI